MAERLSGLHVLIVYDLPEAVHNHTDPDYLLNNDDRPTERDVAKAIRALGFKLSIVGVFDNQIELIKTIESLAPDVIFNLCETFANNRSHEANIAGILAMTGVPVTGSTSESLHLCKDKAITKKILQYDRIKVPKFFECSPTELQDFQFDSLSFPAIVKPLNLEASEGISQASIVHTKDACCDRMKFIFDRFNTSAIIEEFIVGREIYVGVLETELAEIIALPPRELFMRNLQSDQLMFATYKAKWDETYRKKWGIATAPSARLERDTLKKLEQDSRSIFKALGMKGYARIDWRLDQQNQPFFIEANPNPALAKDDDFALAAKKYGRSYNELILNIIQSAIGPLTQREIRTRATR